MLEPCSICKTLTEYRCADCAIDKKEYIPVCENPKCRDLHEEKFCSRKQKY